MKAHVHVKVSVEDVPQVRTHLQMVDELSHRDCLLGVVKCVQHVEVGIVSAVLELESNKVMELGGKLMKNLE